MNFLDIRQIMLWQEISPPFVYLFSIISSQKAQVKNVSTTVHSANCELYWGMTPFIEPACEKPLTGTAFNSCNFSNTKYIQGRFNTREVLH